MIRPSKLVRVGTAFALTTSLAGCFNLSGLNGSSESFSCKAPEGIACASVSGTYANAHQSPAASQAPEPAPNAAPAIARNRAVLSSGDAIRTQPRVLRIWVAPWEDADGDLHDQSMLYLTVDAGRWRIEHNRSRIRKEFSPSPSAPPQPSISMEKTVVQPEMTAAPPTPPAAPSPQQETGTVSATTTAEPQEQGTDNHAE